MKNKFLNILLIAGSFALFLGLLELCLALFYPQKVITQSYHEEYHPLFGWANKPWADGNYYLTRSRFFHRHHNSKGIRSPREIPYEKPAGVKRVLLLGDSFFWGYGDNDEDIVSEVLQKMLDKNIEVINGAVSGYGTDQEALWLVEEGLKYAPDLVILGAFTRNDLEEIAHSIMYGYPKPIFALEGGNLVLYNVPVPDTRETRRKAFEEPESSFGKLKKYLRHHTHSYPFITRRLSSIPGVRNMLIRMGVADEFTTALPGVPNLKHQPEQARPLFEALVLDMLKASSEKGAGFLLLFIPEKENSPGASWKYDGITGIGVENNDTASGYFEKFAASNKINFINLLPAFRDAHLKGERLHSELGIDHHWSPAGHRLAADILFRRLKDNGYLNEKNP